MYISACSINKKMEQKKKARVIAFYLPQFHPIPENDKWWGKGFTEWTNVGKAKPLFKGHYQPRVPADLGYYDLRMPEVREAQAQMAREAGLEGFCYWHYWFGNGKQLLERPFNEVLESGKPDFPFCLGWANHSWTTKTWVDKSGKKSNATIAEQIYPGVNDHVRHFEYVLPAFKDDRYIKVDGKPLFVIFAPLDIPDVENFIQLWRKLALDAGLAGIHFVGIVQPSTRMEKKETVKEKLRMLRNDTWDMRYDEILALGFDAVNSRGLYRAESLAVGWLRRLFMIFMQRLLRGNYVLRFKYSDVVKNLYSAADMREDVYPTLLPQWDRSPRSGKNAVVYYKNSPDAFKESVAKACDLIKNKQEEHKILFLQSWNEWGEGNYVEPDLKYGHAYLDAIHDIILK